MVTREEVFPSRWLKAEDLKGKPYTLKICAANLEALQNANGDTQSKVVLYFHKTTKILPLNRVNFDSCVRVTGRADSNDWPGFNIEVYPTTTPFGGRIVDCIRIRAPGANGDTSPKKPVTTLTAPERMKTMPLPSDEPEPPNFEDDIPF